MTVDFDAESVPDEMKERPQWICWDEIYDEEQDKYRKVPMHADGSGARAKSNDLTTWGAFDETVENAHEYGYGLGYVFAEAGPYVGIDLDDCLGENGDRLDWLPDLDPFDDETYIEQSPSGTGLHIIIRESRIPNWWTNQKGDDIGDVEIYDTGRYFTFTGNVVGCSVSKIADIANDVFREWVETAWYVYNDDPPGADASGGGSSRTGPAADAGDVDIYDVLSRASYPEEERKAHPVHGSDTGNNFQVDEGGETWVCWRGTCDPTGDGDATVGNALHLIGMQENIISCGEWAGTGLTSETWREIFDAARSRGYDIPTTDRAKATGSADAAQASARAESDESGGIPGAVGDIEAADLLDAVDVNDWSPKEVADTSVMIRGQISKRAEPQVRYESVEFQCTNCGYAKLYPQHGETVTPPKECESCGESEFYRGDDEILADYQTVRLQELPERSGTTTGDTIDVDLLDELVDSVTPGDRIIMSALLEPESGEKRVQSLEGTASGIHPLEPDIEDVDIEPYLDAIEAVAAGDHESEHHPTGNPDDTPYDLLRLSIAPKHEGNPSVKSAIVFQLFLSGSTGTSAVGGSTGDANTLHMLLIGDPSTGKSKLLSRVQEIMPRGIYTSGKGASDAGLTASAIQDQFGDGGWTLEAGALVRANGGIAAIDELDKMEKGDRAGLLECMSEQQVSVAKAGMQSTFPAQTTVFAAANPENGHFTDYEKVGEEVGLSSPVVSRFDLRFVLRDEQDTEHDTAVVDRMNAAEIERTGGEPPDVIDQPLDDDLLRAYIQRSHDISPTLTRDAAAIVREKYVEYRDDDEFEDLLGKISPRSVGTIHSLAEASARIRLSETIDPEDIHRATTIHNGMKSNSSGTGAGIGEAGTGIGTMSQKERDDHAHEVIDRLENQYDDADLSGAPTADIVNALLDDGFTQTEAEKALRNLRRRERVYRPRDEEYRTT